MQTRAGGVVGLAATVAFESTGASAVPIMLGWALATLGLTLAVLAVSTGQRDAGQELPPRAKQG